MASISKLFSSLGGTRFFSGKAAVIGLDIGSSAVKVVELEERHGKFRLTKYGTLSLGPFMGESVGAPSKVSQDRLIEAALTTFDAVEIKTRQGAVAIPLKLSLLVTINVPRSAENKLDTVVPLEARKYIPVSPTEVNLAWSVIGEEDSKSIASIKVDSKENHSPTQPIKVLVAAIHNRTLESYQEIATGLSVSPVLFEIETFSAMRSIFGEERGVFAMLDMGSLVSKVAIIDYGSISFTHSIDRGAHALTLAIAGAAKVGTTEAEKAKRKYGLDGTINNIKISDAVSPDLKYIFEEVKKTITEFEKEHKKNVQKVALIGGGAILLGLSDTAKNILGKDVFIGNPFANIEPPTPVLAGILNNAGPEFAVSVGLALRAIREL